MKSSSTTSIPDTKQQEINNYKLLHTLQLKIDRAARLARSNLAKYIFDEANHINFSKLFMSISPDDLVVQLNKINMDPEQFKQFQIFTSNQNEYAELFDLPPAQWIAILTEEKINGEDLAALIGSSELFEGAVSGMLNLIKDIPCPIKRANILFYLNHSADATDSEITQFFKKYETSEFNNASILSLHHILYNVRESIDGGYTRPATEGILRIKSNDPNMNVSPDEKIKNELDNKARIKAALRIMRECIDNLYNKAFSQLTKSQQTQIQNEQSEFIAIQLDAASAKQLNQELNGELSARNVSEFTHTDNIDHNTTNFELSPDQYEYVLQYMQNLMDAYIEQQGITNQYSMDTTPYEQTHTRPSIHSGSSFIIRRELSLPQHITPTHSYQEEKEEDIHELNEMILQQAIQQSLRESHQTESKHMAEQKSERISRTMIK